MGLLQKFWHWLTTSSPRSPAKGHPDLYPIDVEKITKDLKLLEDAKRFGEAGLPAHDAVALSGPEALVVQKIEKARQDYIDWAVFRLNVLSQNLGRRNVTQDVNRASQADKEFGRKASALLTENESVLSALGKTARMRTAELDEFKKKNNLIREANYPTASGFYLRCGLVLFLIVLEGAFNAGFFSQGMDSGLIGGFGMAALLAAMNVVVSFFVGKFLIRLVNHVNVIRKAFGFSFVLASFVYTMFVGLGISHYRDALMGGAQEPHKAALDVLLQNPFHLQDIFSWVLFGISLFFGVIAIFDGLYSDDIYPGYGSVSRRTQLAIDDYEDELIELRGDLERVKNEELLALDKVVQESQSSMAIFESLVDDKRLAGARLVTALRDADNSLEALLRRFRIENELYRKGVRRPDYFDQPVDMRAISMPDFSTDADEAALDEQRTLVKDLLSDVEGIRARIQAAFNQQFDRLKPLGDNFFNEVHK